MAREDCEGWDERVVDVLLLFPDELLAREKIDEILLADLSILPSNFANRFLGYPRTGLN